MAMQARRRYRSETRSAQAARTRARIVASARKLVSSRGLLGATLAAVAEEAAVSLPTVYAVFGSKAELLRAVIDDIKREIGLATAFRDMLAASDAHEQLRLAARVTRTYSEIGGKALDAVRFGSATEPELARLWDEVEAGRYAGQTRLVRAIAKTAGLRPGLNVRSAADELWTLTAHDTYRLMVDVRGWAPVRFERWLVTTLSVLLLGHVDARKGRRESRRASRST